MPAPARRGGLEEAWERGEAAGLRVRSFRGTTFRGAAGFLCGAAAGVVLARRLASVFARSEEPPFAEQRGFFVERRREYYCKSGRASTDQTRYHCARVSEKGLAWPG
jgi:hypothetical protein